MSRYEIEGVWDGAWRPIEDFRLVPVDDSLPTEQQEELEYLRAENDRLHRELDDWKWTFAAVVWDSPNHTLEVSHKAARQRYALTSFPAIDRDVVQFCAMPSSFSKAV